MYLLFTDKCDLSLKIKLKETKRYDKAHNTQDDIKLLELMIIIVCGMLANIQGTWYMMKADKSL